MLISTDLRYLALVATAYLLVVYVFAMTRKPWSVACVRQFFLWVSILRVFETNLGIVFVAVLAVTWFSGIGFCTTMTQVFSAWDSN